MARERLLSCLRAADRSKPAVIGPSGSVGLSGVTPGDREELRFRRASYTALHADRLSQGQTRWSFRRPRVVPLRAMPNPSLLTVLARSFLAGESTVEGIVDRG